VNLGEAIAAPRLVSSETGATAVASPNLGPEDAPPLGRRSRISRESYEQSRSLRRSHRRRPGAARHVWPGTRFFSFQARGRSRKEELGHLVDSAINNYARIIRVQQENAPVLPGYEQDVWVERQGYIDRDWRQIVALWSSLNEHMLAAARRIPAAALARTCTIAGGTPVTLGFVIEDYVDHMVHHLQHIGIRVGEFRRAESAYA
jgi:hypothetical protein